MKKKNFKIIEKIISDIQDSETFKQAFIHSSLKNETDNKKEIKDYETLEWLGDSILGSQTSLYIYKKHSDFSEGQMSKLRQFMIQEKTLAELSEKIGLYHYLKLGTGERKSGGEHKNKILADIFESFIASLYLEKGETKVKKFLNLTLFSWITNKESEKWDYKTELQEICQARHNYPVYRLIKYPSKESKEKIFIVEVFDKLKIFCETGEGKNKKEAEQQAAYKALKKLGEITYFK